MRAILYFCCTCWLLLVLLPPVTASANGPDSVFVRNADGHSVFRLDYFDAGLPYWFGEPPSANNFSPPLRADILRGMEYWTDVLRPHGSVANPVVVRLGVAVDTSYNAGAYYFSNPDSADDGAVWSSIAGSGSALVSSAVTDDPLQGAHSLLFINNYAWDTQPNSNLPETKATLGATIIHEVGHALGIVEDSQKFTALLGTGGTGPGYADRIPYTTDPAQGQLYFYGTKAMELFGAPVPMAHGSDQEAAHFGVRNGLMTHIQITNYPMFMEVELAALEDIGYTIDLRNFFGVSLYDDSTTPKQRNNTQGFFASKGFDADGNWLGYAKGKPNTSQFGVGLHVYGSMYAVTQSADLLADGAGGAGIRVDGFNNSVSIAKDVRVTGNGQQGTGLLVAFGSGHEITSRGTISATGPWGIGARFDFGAPYVNTVLHSYGTYNTNPEYIGGIPQGPTEGTIDGPLVKDFNLSGPLLGGPSSPEGQYLSDEFVNNSGRPIALYIGPGAHVENIHVMKGAFIYGDIISRWNPTKYASQGTMHMTDLTFGRKADAATGAALSEADPAFFLRYRGNILSPSSINVHLEGGSLDYAGTMQLGSFSMAANTLLSTEFIGGNPTTIAASQAVNLSSLSGIDFKPSPFSYGRALSVGKNPVLVFPQTAPNNPTLHASSGSFAMGPYDYDWQGLSFDVARNAVMVNTTRASFNHQRGATDARNAPLAITMRNPGIDAVSARMVRRFADPSAQNALSSLWGVPTPNMGAYWSRGRPFAGSSLQNAGVGLKNTRSRGQSVQWLALADGGWEAAAGNSGLWVTPSYSVLGNNGRRDYSIQGASVTFGIDHYFQKNLYLGLALSVDYPTYKSTDATVRAKGTTGMLYGGLTLPGALELGFSGSFGGTFFEQTRNVGQSQYSSSYNAKNLGLGLGIWRRFQISEQYALRPFAEWNYFYTVRDAYAERADIYGLSYEDSRNRLSRIQAGLDGVWAPEEGVSLGLKAYWSGLSGDTKDVSKASFVLDPDANRFSAPVNELDKNSLGLAMHTGFKVGGQTELRFEYTVLLGKTTTAHQGMLGLRYEF